MKNIPDIRFKGFDEEWKAFILSSIGYFRSNGVDKKIYKDEQIINLLNYTDVYNCRKITSNNCKELMKVSATKKQIIDCNIIKGDIFFTPSSETPDEIGYVMSIEETLPNTCYSYHLMRFRPFDGKIYSSFANYCFSSNYLRKQMKFKAKGVQRFILSKPDFESLEAIMPSYEEQAILTSFFKSVDNLIYESKKKIASLKQLKSASLISMFPQQGETVPRVRFKGFDGEWKIIKLKDVLVERHEVSTITNLLPQLSFTISEGVIKPEDRKTNKRDFLIKDKDNKKYIITRKGDIIYNPANVVFGAIHQNKLCDGVVSPIYKIFYSEQDTKFVECIVRNPAFINKMTLYTEGTVTKLKTLKPESFLDMEVCFSMDIYEQRQIASYFRQLDIQISEQEKRLEKLKQIKAACLDKMFV